jgi:hypothetical protein
MPIFGFDSIGDMFDGGGAGASGGPSSFKGSSLEGLFGGGSKKSGGNDLLSGLGSLIGLAVAGPTGAAIGAGLGNLFSGGSVGSALQAGLGSFATSKFGGMGGAMMGALSGGTTPQGLLSQMTGGLIPSGQPTGTQTQQTQQTQTQQQPGGLLGILNSPLVMAALLKATEPKNVNITSPEQQRQLQTGERLPDYRGTAAFDYRGIQGYAKGGFVRGPGNGTSDSVPARIYQGGRPVQEARLSDGEFVMTNRAVKGAGNGDRAKGAAEMYRMMRQLERRA